MGAGRLDQETKEPVFYHGYTIKQNKRSWKQRSIMFMLALLSGIIVTFVLDIQVQLNPKLYTYLRKADGTDTSAYYHCKPPLPKLLLSNPITNVNDPVLRSVANRLNLYLKARTTLPDIDSLMLSIVTPAGIIWSGSYGKLHANTTFSPPPDRDTRYRLASISKMFTAMETMVLRERGLLNWDDPVEKFIPIFSYRPNGWKDYASQINSVHGKAQAPITLRQLASHMSGLGREQPPREIKSWPRLTTQNFTLPQVTWPTPKEMLKSIQEHPLIVPQYSHPVYSNTGFSVLGWCNVAAARSENASSSSTVSSHAELLQRDIFSPLRMDGSSFIANGDEAHRYAFPRIGHEVDWDLNDGYNPAGGQFSSTNDLAKVMQMFLDPDNRRSILSSYSIREWVRPLHVWSDETTETGNVWEIVKLEGGEGRTHRYYGKSGSLQTFHTKFEFNPDLSFGVIALMTGIYGDLESIVLETLQRFQPLFENLLLQRISERYAGVWKGDNSEIQTIVKDGSLWVSKALIRGVNLLLLVEGGSTLPLPLWSTGRHDEFRLTILARPFLAKNLGCGPSWMTLDPFDSNGAPADLVWFEGEPGDQLLHYPSANVTLTRV